MLQTDRRDVWLYAAIALPVAILFALITPPFQAPDEVGHYWRATAIAGGEFSSTKVNGRSGASIPTDARDLVATLWMDLAGRDLRFDRSKFHNARQLYPVAETVRVTFPAFYTVVPYAPQAAALFLGRLIHCRTLTTFYAGRVANAMAGVVLVMLAMRLLPAAAWAFGCVGLTPMFLYVAGSFSADGVTVGLAFCAMASALRPIEDSKGPWQKAVFPLFAGLLSLAKPGYALITLLGLPRMRERSERLPLCIALVVVVSGGWLATVSAQAAYYPMRTDAVTDASAQILVVGRVPLEIVRIAAADYAQHASQYLDQLVGRLGWLDIGLPRLVYRAYVALFLYAAMSVSLRLGLVERTMLAMVFAATLLILSLSQYVLWTPVAAPFVEGLQGRYFLPLLPAAILLISARYLRWTRWAVCIVTIPGNAIALHVLARHYYGTF
jgi:uncharacterized membrane protein